MTDKPEAPRSTKIERETELRTQLLDDPRLRALIGVAHHALGFSPKEIVILLGGLNQRLVDACVQHLVTEHQDILCLPVGVAAVELRRRFENAAPATEKRTAA